MSKLLQVKKLNKIYEKSITALKEVDFSVSRGDILAVVGASGSGKTTLLRALAGLETVDGGHVLYKDEKVLGPEEQLIPGYKEIRLVHQDFKLFPFQTVFDNIHFHIRSYDADYAEARLDDMMELFRLSQLSDRLPGTLSGGQKQLTTLACALVNEPELLLLDEPFSQLDAHIKDDLKHKIIDFLKSEKITSIWVTHDGADALSYADKILVMKQGEIVQSGTPEELYSNPKDEYVAGFFGPFHKWQNNELIRPENIYLSPGDEESDYIISDVVFYGWYNLLYVTDGEKNLKVRDLSNKWQKGDRVDVTVKAD